jgi:hypothetical protein
MGQEMVVLETAALEMVTESVETEVIEEEVGGIED